MSNKLELWYPTNSKAVTQTWGIYNPAYLPFGFDHHNGIDFAYPNGKEVYCPIEEMVITGLYNLPTGGGNQIVAKSTKPWVVPHLGPEAVDVVLTFMHNEKFLVKVGDVVPCGQQISVGDSTGFSTGPHLHFGVYRQANGEFIDKANGANGSFDPALYWTGFYAKDYGVVINTYKALIDTYKQMVDKFKK